MISSKQKKKKAAVFLSNKSVRYVSLLEKKDGMHVERFDHADLKPGSIKNGEFLEMEFLSNIITKVRKELGVKKIDILLPHSFFKHEKIDLDMKFSSERKMKKHLFKYLTSNVEKYSWVTSHSFEVLFFKNDDGNASAHIQMLDQENYRSLVHIFKKAELEISAIHSEDFAFAHLFKNKGSVLHIRVMEDLTRLASFEQAIHTHDEDLAISYSGLSSAIETTGLGDEEILLLMKKHGFLANYESKEIQSAVSKKAKEALSLLGPKIMEHDTVYVSFEEYMIPGFIDLLQKNFQKEIIILDPVKFPHLLFKNISIIHKKEIPFYASLLLYLASSK